jgi:putative transposase
LPPGDDAYDARWGWIKKEFTKEYLACGGKEQPISQSRRKHGEKGIWQRRYWEHTLDDEHDYERHFDYIHYNPVKHGYADCPKDWEFSSFHRWAMAGVYPLEWGCNKHGPLNFDDLDETAME